MLDSDWSKSNFVYSSPESTRMCRILLVTLKHDILESLTVDQVASLPLHGICDAIVDKESLAINKDVLFCAPEALCPRIHHWQWRELLLRPPTVAVAIDEAHCILKL